MKSMPARNDDSDDDSDRDLLGQAKQLADLGDRWFLRVTGGLERLGFWARTEADIAADSAIAAFATTVDVTKRIARRGGHSSEPDAAPRAHARRTTSNAKRSTPPPKIDLLDATPAKPPRKRRTKARSGVSVVADGSGNRPGVVPLLKALGRVVSAHSDDGYASLEHDERFWTLLCVLQSLRTAAPETAQGDAGAPSSAAAPSGVPARADRSARQGRDSATRQRKEQ